MSIVERSVVEDLVMNYLRNVSDVFWDESFWLPPNYTWKDIEPGNKGVNYADYSHLLFPIPLSMVFILLRYVFEKNCFKPLGMFLRVKAIRDNPPQENRFLENAYRKKSKLNHAMALNLSKQIDLSERDIERWWRRRKAQDKPTTLVKFTETCWRCLCYSFNFSFGLYVLWEKPYLWDILHCAYDYPHHAITNDVWWYYMISMAFYWSLAFSQFVDHKRKDFWQMFIHHVLTLLLISLSWMCNLHRVGSLILFVHDAADVLLEAAKSLNYAKLQKSCDIVFGLFTITWIVTRLMMFPRIIYGCIFQTLLPSYPVYYFFNCMLVSLLILHFIWTHMIFQVIAQSVKSGEIEGDVRSSSEDDDHSDDQKSKNYQ